MPFQHLHDDIERRTSSRASEPCSVFDCRSPHEKEKQQKLRSLGIPAAKVRTIAKAIYSA